MDHAEITRRSVVINAEAFVEHFMSQGPNVVASALSYLAVLAVEGKDKNAGRALSGFDHLIPQFRVEAHALGLMQENGEVHLSVRENIAAFLRSDPLYASELTSVESILTQPRKPASPGFVASMSKTVPSSQLIASIEDTRAKIDAVKSGDTEMLQSLVSRGVPFTYTDLLSVVTHEKKAARPDMLRIVLDGGATCPDWLRPSIKDPELLDIIDRAAGTGKSIETASQR